MTRVRKASAPSSPGSATSSEGIAPYSASPGLTASSRAEGKRTAAALLAAWLTRSAESELRGPIEPLTELGQRRLGGGGVSQIGRRKVGADARQTQRWKLGEARQHRLEVVRRRSPAGSFRYRS